jgi:hypothetical protein
MDRFGLQTIYLVYGNKLLGKGARRPAAAPRRPFWLIELESSARPEWKMTSTGISIPIGLS